MLLRAITNGAITGTGEITVKSFKIGAVLITTDNSNAATVILRREDASGKPIFDIQTVTTIWVAGPISTEDTTTNHYTISGTSAEAQLYEWID